jgi:hypothetical protein
MSIREYNSNRELTASELEIVTGGVLKELMQDALNAVSKAQPNPGQVLGKVGVSLLSSMGVEGLYGP